MKQLRPKDVKEAREELIQNQFNKCALCKRPLNLNDSCPSLDHCHQSGRVRGALCRSCNTAEGIIIHKFMRSGLKGKGVDYIEWLRLLADYLEADYSHMDFHPQHMIDQTKLFNKLTLPDQRSHLDELNIAYPEKATKSTLSKIYKKSFLLNPRMDFDNSKYTIVEDET